VEPGFGEGGGRDGNTVRGRRHLGEKCVSEGEWSLWQVVVEKPQLVVVGPTPPKIWRSPAKSTEGHAGLIPASIVVIHW